MRFDNKYNAKICDFRQNMRFKAGNMKIMRFIAKTVNNAVSHVPHLNPAPGLYWPQ